MQSLPFLHFRVSFLVYAVSLGKLLFSLCLYSSPSYSHAPSDLFTCTPFLNVPCIHDLDDSSTNPCRGDKPARRQPWPPCCGEELGTTSTSRLYRLCLVFLLFCTLGRFCSVFCSAFILHSVSFTRCYPCCPFCCSATLPLFFLCISAGSQQQNQKYVDSNGPPTTRQAASLRLLSRLECRVFMFLFPSCLSLPGVYESGAGILFYLRESARRERKKERVAAGAWVCREAEHGCLSLSICPAFLYINCLCFWWGGIHNQDPVGRVCCAIQKPLNKSTARRDACDIDGASTIASLHSRC